MAKKYIEYKQNFTRFGYQFRLNQMNDSVECNGMRMTDIISATIESKMFDADFTSAAGIKRSYTRLASENAYHPIKEWLDGLLWNGQDIFGNLMRCFTFEHQQISERFFWRFLVGCVGKVMSDGWQQNVMLILDGIQGIGKSHLSGWLLPSDMLNYFVEGGLEPEHKDTKVRVVSNFLWEVGELQGMTKKADLEALKNIITQRQMNVRLPYGHFDIDKPVTCSFIGTVNESGSGFLNDITGNRRFAVVRVNQLDWQYSKLDQTQLWAQIYAAYKAGERGTFTAQEKAEQITINAEYDTLSHVAEFFFSEYDIDLVTYQDTWTPIAEIIKNLELSGLSKSNQRMHFMDLAGILTRGGCCKSNKNKVTGHGRKACYSGIYEKSTQKAGHIPGFP